MGSVNQKNILDNSIDNGDRHIIYTSDTTFCALPLELFCIIVRYIPESQQRIATRLISRWFYNASHKVFVPVLNTSEIEQIEQHYEGCYVHERWDEALYLELFYNEKTSPHNTFQFYYVNGSKEGSPESYCEGQWVTCAMDDLCNAKRDRERQCLSDEAIQIAQEKAKQELLTMNGKLKRVLLRFNEDYDVRIYEGGLYSELASFQWDGKAKLEGPWRFSVTIRSDGSVCGGGKGFGILEQNFSGTWRYGIVNLTCKYSDGSVALFYGQYSEKALPDGVTKRHQSKQLYFLELTVEICSMGPVLAKANVVNAGDKGKGLGYYVPQYQYENLFDSNSELRINQKPRERNQSCLVLRDKTSSDGKAIEKMGKVNMMMRLGRRRLLGTNLQPEMSPLYRSVEVGGVND